MWWAWMVVLLVVVGCSGGTTTRRTMDERAELAGAGDGEAGAGAGEPSSGGASSPAVGASGAQSEDGGEGGKGGSGASLGGDSATGGEPTGGALPSTGGAAGGARPAAGGGVAGGAIPATGGDGGGGDALTTSGGTGAAAGWGGGGGDAGAGGCSLVYRVTYLDEPAIQFSCATAAGDWAYHGMCEDGSTDWITVPGAPALAAGAVVVEAWTSVAVDETRPDTWPRLWVEGLEGDAKPVAGAPVSRLWFDVGEREAGAVTLRADQINGLDDTERDLNVDAVEFWECAP